MSLIVWVVMDGDYDSDWIVAAYDSEALALDHIERTGIGLVHKVIVLSALPDSVASIDPVAARLARQEESEARRAAHLGDTR